MKPPILTRQLIFLGVAILAWTSIQSAPQRQAECPSWYHHIDENGIAIDGYDVVSYHLDSGPQQGNSKYQSTHQGIVYQFATAENLGTFEKSPEAYLPAFGGWCSFFMGLDQEVHGQPPRRFPPDPTHFEIIDKRLFLFARTANVDSKQQWVADPKSQKRSADFWATRVALGKKFPVKPDGLNHLARMETLQFDFFVGQWESRYKVRVNPDVEGYSGIVRGDWKAWYGWDGFAIYDDWKQVGAIAGNSGPAIRSYDPFHDEWVMHFIPINAPMETVWQIRGKFDENGELHGEMKSTDAQGRSYLQRIHFVEITDDRFEWRSDRSYDDGETWIENWGVGENFRVKKKTEQAN